MTNHANDQLLSRGIFDQINELCRQFMGECKSGGRPSLEDYLARVSEDARTNLLRNVLSIEIEFRRRRKEQPTSEEYIRRLPQHSVLIREAFFESTMRSLHSEEDTGKSDGSRVAATAPIAIIRRWT